MVEERGVTCERLQMTTGSYERFEKFDLKIGKNIFEFLLNSNVSGWVEVPIYTGNCSQNNAPTPTWRLNYIKVMEM